MTNFHSTTSGLRCLAIALGLILTSTPSLPAERTYGSPPPDLKYDLNRLVAAYPDWIDRVDGQYLIMKDGKKFPISDKLTRKTFRELLERPDIDDMFFAAYPAGKTPGQPSVNFDPGRVRFEPLFVAMYGDCTKRRLTGKFRTIPWLPRHRGGSVSITRVNGVDRALAGVSRELDALPDGLMKYLIPTSGTFNCRRIAGSTARSMHAYGAAIDINSKYADYWRWSSANPNAPKWRNRIPMAIVRIFERHGFIWGGYWYHYDTMHFEYRPELLPSAQR
jgi:D-alanyl-D-alanine carboxypeptidase